MSATPRRAPSCRRSTSLRRSCNRVPGEWGEFDYSRSGNPTRQHLETTLASLESGCRALAFSSGMAATHCVTMLLQTGDHILAGADIYGGTYRLLHKIVNRAGLRISLADSTDLAAFAAHMTPQTKLVWIETPGNPRMTITDIAACAELAHQHGALLGVDNTFASPALTRPLELGADIVMHSATKYLGGHSDLLGGALVGPRSGTGPSSCTSSRMRPEPCWALSSRSC